MVGFRSLRGCQIPVPTLNSPPGMNSLTHALNTGTLAAWLSVAGFGTVGVLMPDWREAPPPPPPAVVETKWVEPEILLGDAEPPADPAPAPPAADPVLAEPLPAPPELTESAAVEPLPEIPELPPPPSAAPTAKPAKPVVPARPRAGVPQPGTSARQVAAASPGAGIGTAGGRDLSDVARLAGGHMPSPTYPTEARRKGQTGTVTVEFTVDSSGRVVAAFAKFPSPWPLLNEEAVRTVRRWRFPPGGVMKLQRPIIFQLR